MIGQHNIYDNLCRLVTENKLPRFMLLIGCRGSGKKYLAGLLGRTQLKMAVVYIEPKVDNIREMISNAYTVTLPTFYIIPDADTMSPASKNAMLKVTEEPPNNAYFCMTLTDSSNALPTIRSRATSFYMDPYTPVELTEYYYEKYPNRADGEEELRIITNICNTPGDVDMLVKMNPIEFWEYVNKVVENIDEVSTANAFKIGSKIAFKDTEDSLYDLKLFLRTFATVCILKAPDDAIRYGMWIKTTSKYLQELKSVSVSKQNTFDMWLLEIRGEGEQ